MCIRDRSIHKLKNKYELLWDQRSPEGYLKILAVLQMYIDQGISVNTSYNQEFYEEAKINMNQINAIACTQGPGLLGSLLVGNSFAKSLSMSLKIPLIAINHMQAHLMVHFIKDEGITPPDFPFIGVNVSGGHTQIIIVRDYFNMEIIGKTLDDAIGEAFDKCGKKIGLDQNRIYKNINLLYCTQEPSNYKKII